MGRCGAIPWRGRITWSATKKGIYCRRIRSSHHTRIKMCIYIAPRAIPFHSMHRERACVQLQFGAERSQHPSSLQLFAIPQTSWVASSPWGHSRIVQQAIRPRIIIISISISITNKPDHSSTHERWSMKLLGEEQSWHPDNKTGTPETFPDDQFTTITMLLFCCCCFSPRMNLLLTNVWAISKEYLRRSYCTHLHGGRGGDFPLNQHLGG